MRKKDRELKKNIDFFFLCNFVVLNMFITWKWTLQSCVRFFFVLFFSLSWPVTLPVFAPTTFVLVKSVCAHSSLFSGSRQIFGV